MNNIHHFDSYINVPLSRSYGYTEVLLLVLCVIFTQQLNFSGVVSLALPYYFCCINYSAINRALMQPAVPQVHDEVCLQMGTLRIRPFTVRRRIAQFVLFSSFVYKSNSIVIPFALSLRQIYCVAK
jgi:hypothetical protein